MLSICCLLLSILYNQSIIYKGLWSVLAECNCVLPDYILNEHFAWKLKRGENPRSSCFSALWQYFFSPCNCSLWCALHLFLYVPNQWWWCVYHIMQLKAKLLILYLTICQRSYLSLFITFSFLERYELVTYISVV